MIQKTRLTAGFLSRPIYEPEIDQNLMTKLASEKSQRVQLESENNYLKDELKKQREKNTTSIRTSDQPLKPANYLEVKEFYILEDGTNGEERS